MRKALMLWRVVRKVCSRSLAGFAAGGAGTLFHFLIDPLINILSKSTNISGPNEAINGLDGLPEV